MKILARLFFIVLFLFLLIISGVSSNGRLVSVCLADAPPVIINEVAWMGTNNQYDEWIELYNNSNESIDLKDWKILTPNDKDPNLILFTIDNTDKNACINLIIDAKGFFLIKRITDSAPGDTVSNKKADCTGSFGGSGLSDSGERIELKDDSDVLIDSLGCSSGWFAGSNKEDKINKYSMERKNPALSGNDSLNWQNSAVVGGTPKAQNSSGAPPAQDASESSIEMSDETESTIATSTSTPASNDHSPVASAGLDIIALVNQNIAFDTIQSSDPDGDSLTYRWNFGDGATSDKPKPNHSYQYPGTYIAVLEVADEKNSSSDQLTVTVYSNAIIISEFMPAPTGADQDNEWIELYNDSGQMVDLSKWQVDDVEGGSKPFALPKNTLLAGHQYLVLQRPTTKIALNNDTDSVRLIYPTGQVAQEIKYTTTKEDQSVSLAGSRQYLWSAAPTPGGPNFISADQQKINNQISAAITQPGENTESIQSVIPQEAVLTVAQEVPTCNLTPQTSISAPQKEISSFSKKSDKTNNQTASLTETIKSSPATTLLFIIAFGVLAGLGLIKIRRRRGI